MLSVLLIGVSLSVDAFAVAVTNGLTIRDFRLRHGLWLGLYFGAAQCILPLLGWVLGGTVAGYIRSVSPYVSFCVLGFIGGKMLWESFSPSDTEGMTQFSHRRAAALAVATALDALAVGVSFAFSPPAVGILPACAAIGAVTFALSLAGSLAAGRVPVQPRSAMAMGGAALLAIGFKLLMEGLFGTV